MEFKVVTLFSPMFASFVETSLVGKAIASGTVSVDFVDPRDFTEDRHRTVDDAPYGGGSGMVLKAPPVVAAIEAACGRWANASGAAAPLRVLLTPQGERLGQVHLRRLAARSRAVLVCGRYEGFDERIRRFVDLELSLGDFVLNGGEVAAMAIIDGVARLVPGVLGNARSLERESHADGLLEHPHYTRPAEFRGLGVPEVLLGGDHAAIERWRVEQMRQRTRERRPDLWAVAQQAGSGEDAVRPGRRADDAEVGVEADQRAEQAQRTHVALLHHPVYDKSRRVVTTALTNLDLHDIARSSKTYGLGGYHLVTPLESQRQLAERILSHWRDGHGARHNDKRGQALALLQVAHDLQEVIDRVAAREGATPLVVATTAAQRAGQVGEQAVFQALEPDRPLLLVLGTGWGLTEQVLDAADLVLRPLRGPTAYNHLSVRSAAAIMLDRLFGRDLDRST